MSAIPTNNHAITYPTYLVLGGSDSRVRLIYPNGTPVWTKLVGETGSVTAVRLDSEKSIYAASTNNTVIKFNEDGEQVWVFTGHTGAVNGIEVDADGFVYTVSSDNTVRKLEQTLTGVKEIWSFTGHTDNVLSVTVDENKNVYTCSADGTVRKLSSTGTQEWSFTGHTGAVNDIALDVDDHVYSVSNDNTVRKIDTDGTQLWSVTHHTANVMSVTVDPNGFVYTGSVDQTVKKMNESDGSVLWSFTGHSSTVNSVTVNGDGFVYTGSANGVTKKIDLDGNDIDTVFSDNTLSVLAIFTPYSVSNDSNNPMNIDLQQEMSDVLKGNIPEFQRGDNPLTAYVDTTGDVLDEMRTTVRALSGYLNWNDAPLGRINQLASSFGFNFPRNLGEDTRRTIVRDIFNIYKRNGTPDMFRWIFKVVGWDVQLQYAWALNPTDLLRGKRRIIYNGEYVYNGEITYGQQNNVDLEQYNYQDFVYGESRVTADGVFFYGKDYFDNENAPGYTPRYQKIPIQGEKYSNYRVSPDDTVVASTPYLIVRITAQDYRLFTEPYTDPDTGITYEYTDSERFAIANELINFLLYERGRPLQVRVIVIVTDDLFQDDVDNVQTDLTQEFTGWSDLFTDEGNIDVNVSQLDPHTFNFDSLKAGDGVVASANGWVTPINETSGMSGAVASDGPITLTEDYTGFSTSHTFTTYFDGFPAVGQTKAMYDIAIRYDTTLVLTLPANVELRIYATDAMPLPLQNFTQIEYVAAPGTDTSISRTYTTHHGIRFEFTNVSNSSVAETNRTISITYNAI